MIEFDQNYLDMFLSVVRKYMQLRGGLSQKDLAEKVNIGVSTMSRFLNKKVREFDAQMIAAIVAKLEIPLHEIIDFIVEDSTETFKKLVNLYREEERGGGRRGEPREVPSDEMIEEFEQQMNQEATRQRTSYQVKGVKIPFGGNPPQQGNMSIREKLNQLSPRQKGFLTDFLDLDTEGRDLIVDLGNTLFRYFKQSNTNF